MKLHLTTHFSKKKFIFFLIIIYQNFKIWDVPVYEPLSVFRLSYVYKPALMQDLNAPAVL